MADIVLAKQAECEGLEEKNNDLSTAFMKKVRAHAREKKMHDTLKGQVMASQVAVAAGDEAEMTLQTAQGHRFLDRMPGARIGAGAHNRTGGALQQLGGEMLHNRQVSGGSGSSSQQRSATGLGPPANYAQHLRGRDFSSRAQTNRKCKILRDPRFEQRHS